MIIPDINLLLYAYDADSPVQKRAAEWLEECLSGEEVVGLLPVVLFGFIRIGTNPRVFRTPMTPAQAADHARLWLAQPNTRLLEPGSGHLERVFRLLKTLGTGGNMVTDAQLAAAALEHDAVLHSADSDFQRFEGLRWYNPLSQAEIKKSRGRRRS